MSHCYYVCAVQTASAANLKSDADNVRAASLGAAQALCHLWGGTWPGICFIVKGQIQQAGGSLVASGLFLPLLQCGVCGQVCGNNQQCTNGACTPFAVAGPTVATASTKTKSE